MTQLNHGRPQPLQFVANAAFLASLFVDYLNATSVPGFMCGPTFIPLDDLRSFATSQVPLPLDLLVSRNNNDFAANTARSPNVNSTVIRSCRITAPTNKITFSYSDWKF